MDAGMILIGRTFGPPSRATKTTLKHTSGSWLATSAGPGKTGRMRTGVHESRAALSRRMRCEGRDRLQ